MRVQRDSSDQPFVDTPTLLNEHVRTTFVREDRAGYGVDSVRVQIRDATGHLRQGPEVPLAAVPGLIAAAMELIRENT